LTTAAGGAKAAREIADAASVGDRLAAARCGTAMIPVCEA